LFAQVDDSPNPLQFSQVFTLAPGDGRYYVYVHLQYARDLILTTGKSSHNEIFRLNYGS
jgi:hypothetical protein